MTRPLPCPECREAGIEGAARVGNRRSNCGTCNRFAAAVRRELGKQLIAAHPDEVTQRTPLIETHLYYSRIQKGAPG